MAHQVRLNPSVLADELVATLAEAGAPARRLGELVLVEDDGPNGEPERELELLFFVRTWALGHPELDVEIVHDANGALRNLSARIGPPALGK